MDWFPITLICAFSLASADAATKRWLADAGVGEILLLRLGLTGVLLSPLALAGPWPDLPAPFWAWLALLVPLELLAMWLYMQAIRDHPLALTLPYLSFTPVFVTVTGSLVLGERVVGPGLAGIGLVVAGSWLLNTRAGASGTAGLWRPFAAIATNPGARRMLLAAAIYAVTSVGGKAALQWLPAERFGPVYFLLVGGAALLVFGIRRPRYFDVLRRRPGAAVVVAGLSAVMVYTHFLALEGVETAYMIAVKRTSLLFGILYGAWLFREPHLRRNLAAGSLMVGGVALILTGQS